MYKLCKEGQHKVTNNNSDFLSLSQGVAPGQPLKHSTTKKKGYIVQVLSMVFLTLKKFPRQLSGKTGRENLKHLAM